MAPLLPPLEKGEPVEFPGHQEMGHPEPVTGPGTDPIPTFLAHNRDTAESLSCGSVPEE